ncbi:MAG: HAD family hydrolase [Planctomycetaceae bacterium]
MRWRLATPLAVWTALGAAAKRGVLFRGGEALETLARIRAIRWDKTGTLTTGSPRVDQLICEDAAQHASVEAWAGVLTNASTHLYAQAIPEYLADECAESPVQNPPAGNTQSAGGVQTVPGRGLRLELSDGRRVILGSVRWMDECGFRWGPNLSQLMADSMIADSPLAAIAFNGSVQGLFVLEEFLRPEASRTIGRCRDLGLDQAILTGDRRSRGLRLAELLSFSESDPDSSRQNQDRRLKVSAELLPKEKLAAVRAAHQEILAAWRWWATV